MKPYVDVPDGAPYSVSRSGVRRRGAIFRRAELAVGLTPRECREKYGHRIETALRLLRGEQS